MGNKATTIDEQIQRLTDRGMSFTGFSKTKIEEILLDIGYYRLGFYWNPFEIDNKHNLNQNTEFKNVVELYYLDVNLRHLLAKAINRIEINFRTKLIYYVSNQYVNSPTWFIDKKIMHVNFTNGFNNYYNNKFINNNNPIKKHHKKYINDKYAPAWKTLEFFTFGTILKIYENILDIKTKQDICKLYGINDIGIFINYMKTIKFIRNECAHGGVLFDLSTPKGISKHKSIQFNPNSRHNLDSCIRVILYFLNSVSTNRCDDSKIEINQLFEDKMKNTTLKSIIENKIGYVNSF